MHHISHTSKLFMQQLVSARYLERIRTFRGLLSEPLILIEFLIALFRVVFKQREVCLFPGEFMDDYYEDGRQVMKVMCSCRSFA